MDYQALSLRCQCGETPSRIEEVGLSAAHELVIHWWCDGCKRVVYTTMPLTDCWGACPIPDKPGTGEPAVLVRTVNEPSSDADFLRSIGVRLPDHRDP